MASSRSEEHASLIATTPWLALWVVRFSNMPPYELKPEYMHFYVIGGTDNPIEVVLDYVEPDGDLRGWAGTC